jgi:sec-independent protein translocase protein TatA
VAAIVAVFQQFGLPEILIILVILLFLFGARKLPELARSLGRSTKEFKTGLKEGGAEEEIPPTTDEEGRLHGSEDKPAR